MSGENKTWRDELPDDLKGDPSLKDIPDVPTLAKSYVSTKSLVGASVRPPGPDAKPEDKKAFIDRMVQIEPALIYAPDGDKDAFERMWKKLGKPGKPEEYEVPEEAKQAGLDEHELRMLGAKTGLTKAQFKELVGTMSAATLEQKRLAAIDRLALDTEWGAAKEERTLAAKAAALKMGLNEKEVEGLTPKQLRVFFTVARAVGVNHNEFRRQQDGTGAPALDPQEAKHRMGEIRLNPHYFDAHTNPAEHARLKVEMSKLSEVAYGEK